MSDIPSSFFFNFSLYLLIPFVFALFFRKSRISPIIGYMLGGIVLSNFFDGLISRDIINNFAYFGIVFLMFTLGLEIQFDQMIALRKFIVWGGFLQITLSIIIIGVCSLLFGFTLIQSFLIGIALSSSSTSLVAKIIQDRGEEGSFHGELAMGILMFQDLAFIPFVIIFNSITTKTVSFTDITLRVFIDMFTSGLILWFAYYFGHRIAPFIFNKIARASRELLNLFIILTIFIIAYISTLLHIPVLVSMFVAGILVSQTMEHYHIFSQVRPLRDLLSIIFFIYIGTNIKIGLVGFLLPKIIAFALLIMIMKALVILFIFLFMKFHSKLSLYLSLFLFQVDEDAFILMSVAYVNKMFTQEEYLFIITAVMLSLLCTPFLIGSKEKIYRFIRSFINTYLPPLHTYIKHHIDRDQSHIEALEIKNHVILCGYGRIGSYVGRALMLSNIPFIAIDYNFPTVEKAKREGINILYGDPTDIDILDYAEAEHAVAIVTALPDRFSQETIILHARKLNKNILIISRAHRKKDQKRMKDMGVKVVIQPEFEASLSIIRKLMLLKRMPKDEIVKKLHYFKLEQEGI
ncbi:cation:proton antiporter [Candidatus Roizmanbacteria bacterium]|nr:cation:proton antiporter [Candidatus Roizmanbacteria bacterium]